MWHEFAVAIVCDGRAKMNKSTAEYMQKDIKVLDPDMIKLEHNLNPVTCHIFEKTIDLPKHSSQREYFKPLQIILAVKEANGGKVRTLSCGQCGQSVRVCVCVQLCDSRSALLFPCRS